MSENKKITVNDDELKHRADSSADDKRRQILKGSLAVPPVIMSVMGKSAWGGYACNLSGQMSGNLSQPQLICGGEACSPGFWKNTPGAWHDAYPIDLVYSSVFNTAAFGSAALYEVIGLCGKPIITTSDIDIIQLDTSACTGDIDNIENCQKKTILAAIRLGFHSVAALQSAAGNVSYAKTVAEVIMETNAAFAIGTKDAMEIQKDIFDKLIEDASDCPLEGSHGQCNLPDSTEVLLV